MNTTQFLQIGREAVSKAEAVILEYFDQVDVAVESKADTSPVTAADKQAEAIIRAHIKAAFPDHGFYGEEEGNTDPDTEYQWIIDPIDGTKNFIRKLPFFSTELALAHNGEIILGVSNAPLLKKTLTAVKGEGSFLNGKRVQVSKINDIANTYLSIGSLKYFVSNSYLQALEKLSQDVFQCRSFGDTWSYQLMAEGLIDVVIEPNVKIWDIAAMTIIITEASGIVSDIDGKPVTLQTQSLIAANRHVHAKVLEYFNN